MLSTSLITLFAFRHGETDWNLNKRIQGHTDIPLNDLGRAQAKELAARMQQLHLDVIVTSDLGRAKETAEIVNGAAKVPIVVSDRLRECNLGDFEGLYRDDAIARSPDMWERWFSVSEADQDFKFPGGETKRENLKRCADFLEAFIKAHPTHKRIGVSTHGGTLLRLIHSCEGAPSVRSSVGNCSLRELSYDPATNCWAFVRDL